MFQVGDRVVSIVNSPDGNEHIVVGSTGTVCDRRDNYNNRTLLYIEWDEDICGHDCDGLCKCGHGWNVYAEEVELYSDISDEFSVEDDITLFNSLFEI